MRVVAVLALGTTLFTLAPVASAEAAAWPSCVSASRTKLNNSGWSDPKWQVRVSNRCSRTIKYSIVRDFQSDFDYVSVKPGKGSFRNIGKFSFGHSASEPDGVKIYYKGTRYTKRF